MIDQNILNSIKSDFTLMVANSQNLDYNSLNFDKLFEQWSKNKQYFYDLFRQQLIYKSKEKITFHLDEQTRCDRVEEFLDWLNNSFIWSDTENADLGALDEFINNNRNSFFKNKVEKTYQDRVHFYGYEEPAEYIEIPAGTKLIKAFKYYIKDKDLLYTIQNKASTIIQEDKIEGYMCLSIHPLDYLTISENTLGWRSCHSLDGDFRGGNLNYMADKATVVCYLESSKPTNLHGVSWNNKKWRMLLFFSQDKEAIFAGRQYPFKISTALDQVHNLLSSVVGILHNWSNWHEGIKEVNSLGFITRFPTPYYNFGTTDGLVSLENLVVENKNKLYYNDLLRSSIYQNPYYTVELSPLFGIATGFDHHIHIGEDVVCPKCGNRYITSGDWMLCDVCANAEIDDNNLVPCAYCDRLINVEDGYIVSDHGEVVCENCASEYTCTCDRCGHRYHNDEMTWNKETQQMLCGWCTFDVSDKEHDLSEKGEIK